jgi:cbb3-type cytochrome oxidase subunit 3
MFKHYFETMEGIAQYPLFSLLVFVSFFVGVFVWAMRTRKSYIDHMSNLPLDDSSLTA